MKHLPTILLAAAPLALVGCEAAPFSPTPVALGTPVPEPEPDGRLVFSNEADYAL